jgi:hypothetical protein
LTDPAGNPYVKTHGFGATGQSILLRYPWFSCDSTSWTMAPSYGQVPVPVYENGKPNYLKKAHSIIISDHPSSNASNSVKGKVFENLGDLAQAQVIKFLAEEVGITLVDARYDPNLRRRAFLKFFMSLVAQKPPTGFRHRLASVHAKIPRGMKAQKPFPVKLFFATGPWHGQYSDLMHKVGANNRLISYFDVRTDPDFGIVEHTVRTGLHRGWTPNETPRTNPRKWGETYRMFRIFRTLYRLGYEPHEHSRFVPEEMRREKRRITGEARPDRSSVRK